MSHLLASRVSLVVVLTVGTVTVAASSVSSSRAQAPSVESPPAAVQPPSHRFKSGADATVLDVRVTPRAGGPVPALSADDFLVLDNNVPQDLVFFAGEECVPLAVTLLIDGSSSMAGPKLEAAKASALAFLDTLRPGDLVEVIAFNERANRLFPLGPPDAGVNESFAGLSGSGQTGLFEAVLVGLRDLERAEHPPSTPHRSALIVLSDGDDTSSVVAFDDVLEDVRRSNVIVYALSLRTDEHNRSLAPPRELSKLARDSGGRAVIVQTVEGLAPTYQAIGADLRTLYRVGFVPADAARDGLWHTISVRVPGRDVHVQARTGYYAPRPSLR